MFQSLNRPALLTTTQTKSLTGAKAIQPTYLGHSETEVSAYAFTSCSVRAAVGRDQRCLCLIRLMIHNQVYRRLGDQKRVMERLDTNKDEVILLNIKYPRDIQFILLLFFGVYFYYTFASLSLLSNHQGAVYHHC